MKNTFTNQKWSSQIGYFLFRNSAIIFAILFFAFIVSLAMWLENSYGLLSAVF